MILRSLGVLVVCAVCSCTTVPIVGQKSAAALQVPAELGDCTLTLSGTKAGSKQACFYTMGYDAPMPKLKIFAYLPQGDKAEISFDGVGDARAVHFNGTIRLTEQRGKTYRFVPTGEMKGFDPENFEASPTGMTITLNPNE